MQAIDQTKATRRADRQSQRTLFALCPILIILAALLVGAALTSADTTTVVGGALPSATSTPAGLDNSIFAQNGDKLTVGIEPTPSTDSTICICDIAEWKIIATGGSNKGILTWTHDPPTIGLVVKKTGETAVMASGTVLSNGQTIEVQADAPCTYTLTLTHSNEAACHTSAGGAILKVDIEDAGARETDELQVQHFENNNGTFTYTAIPYQIYYTIEPDTGWAPDNVLLKIRDASGAVIRTKLLSVGTGIGQQQATWDGQDDSGAYPEYGSNTYTAEIVVNKGATVCSDKKIFSIYEIRQGNNLYRDNGWPVPDIHGAILYEYNGVFNSLADLQDDSKYTVVHHRGASGTMATDSVAVFKTGGSGTYMGAHCPDELKNAGRRAKRKAVLEKAAQMLAANPPYISPVTDVLHHKGLTWDGTIADIAETRSDGVNEVSYEGVSVRLYGSSWWSITTPSPSTNLDKHNEGSDSMLPSKQRSGPLTTNTPDELRKP